MDADEEDMPGASYPVRHAVETNAPSTVRSFVLTTEAGEELQIEHHREPVEL